MKTPLFPAHLVRFPECGQRRSATFYLAAEEYIAATLPPASWLFTWQTPPTVVVGRSQVLHLEVNMDFCHREGIDICRRKSGGGSIFSDRGNIMTSLVVGEGAVEPLFRTYAEQMAKALQQLGVPARTSGRNDIVLSPSGAKIAGNAFYHQAERNIVHGTLLYDTASRLMEGALTPDRAKLESKGVRSVTKRIGLLKDVLPNHDTASLRHALHQLLCCDEIVFSEDDIKRIGALEQHYYSKEYLYGLPARNDWTTGKRIEGCGHLEVAFQLRGSLIEDVNLTGDFFVCGQEEPKQVFRKAFVGQPFTSNALTQAIQAHHPEQSIAQLSAEALASILSTRTN